MSKGKDHLAGAIAILFGLPLFFLAAPFIASNSNNSNSNPSSSGYNDSIPAGMTQAESNYIGNRLAEEGYSENEAKVMREAIHKFNQLQKDN